MHQKLRLGVIVIAIILSGCDKKNDARLATPKGAATTLFQAMYDNDLSLAKSCVIEGTGQSEFVEGMTKMLVAARSAMEAAYKRYGDEFNKMAGGSLDTLHIDAKQIDAAVETVNGDTATLAFKNGKTTFHLVRKDKIWKVDMVKSLTGNNLAVDQQTVRAVTGMFAGTARAAEQTKNEIESAKYPGAQAAVQGLISNIHKAIEEEKSRAIRELAPR